MANSKYTKQEVLDLMDSDEPIFILRAKDVLSIKALQAYTGALMERDQNQDAVKVVMCEADFRTWQIENEDKIQFPTL